MRERVGVERYGAVAQCLHWAMALLIFANVALAWIMEDLPLGPGKADLYNLHKSIGLSLLALAALRVLWRVLRPPPALPPTMAAWEIKLSKAAHHLLYLLLFAVPLAGLLIAFASAFPTVIYGLFVLPSPLAPDEAVADFAEALHETLVKGLILLVGLHLAAVLKHHVLDRDEVLWRMLPGGRR